MKNRKRLGFILGVFFGLFGLFGLFWCYDEEEKNSFFFGWGLAFMLYIAIIILFFINIVIPLI